MASTSPVAYTPQDRIKLLQNQQAFGSGVPRQLNFSSNFTIQENDLDNYYKIDLKSTSSGGITSITNAGLAGTSIIESATIVAASLRAIEAATNRIAVAYDSTNKAVSIDVSLPNIPLDSLGNVQTSSVANNDVISWDSATSKWKNKVASGGALTTLTDVTVTSPANNDVLTYETSSTKWKNKPLTSERVGKSTANGNGSTTVFNIAHGLGSNPTYAFIVCSSLTNVFTYTTDSTNIVVTFTTAPGSGTGNVIIYWRVVA